MAFHLSHRAQLVLRYFGIATFGLVVFAFALQWTFPYDRVKDRVLEQLNNSYDASILTIERGILPGHFTLKGVTLRTRPDPKNATTTIDAKGATVKVDEVPTTFFIEKIDVNVHILPLLHMTGAADFDMKIGPGHISGDVSVSKSDFSIDLDGQALPSGSLPMREALGLPMTGKVEFSVALDLPSEVNKAGKTAIDWTKAEGDFTFACPSGCTFGDGHTKLKPKLKNSRNQAFAADGIDFGKVNIESLVAKVEIKDGKLAVTKFETKSNDGELHVDFAMQLAPVLDDSVVTGCLRFKGSETLAKNEPKTYAALQTTGAPLNPADNLFHIKLTDKLRDMKRLGLVCGDAADQQQPQQPTARPNLAPEPPKPVVPVTATPPTIPTPPPAVPPPPPAGGNAAGAGSAPGSAVSAEGSAKAEGSAEGSAQPEGSAAPPPPQIP
jgi:type II secretion system protein N